MNVHAVDSEAARNHPQQNMEGVQTPEAWSIQKIGSSSQPSTASKTIEDTIIGNPNVFGRNRPRRLMRLLKKVANAINSVSDAITGISSQKQPQRSNHGNQSIQVRTATETPLFSERRTPHIGDGVMQMQISLQDQDQSLGMMESDQRSIGSDDSDVVNKYQVYVTVEDLNGRQFKVLVQFDTGASSAFISQGTLDLLGDHGIHPLPRAKSYRSPVVENAYVTTTQCASLKMWNDELGFREQAAMLKIMPGIGVFQIIIGRNLMDKYRPSVLFARMEKLSNHHSIPSQFPNVIGAVLKVPRNKAQRETDLVNSQQQEELRRREYLERCKILASTPDVLRAGQSTRIDGSQGSSSMGNGVYRQHAVAATMSSEAENLASTNKESIAKVLRPDYTQTPAQQETPGNSVEQAGFQIRRADTTSTQYTQFTQFSLGRQSTAFSQSSYGTDVSDAAAGVWKRGAPEDSV